MRLLFLSFSAGLLSHGASEPHEEFERVPNDGWFNNLLHPDWGAIGKASQRERERVRERERERERGGGEMCRQKEGKREERKTYIYI